MSKKNRKGISSFSIGLTSTLSVTLLLILLGIIAVMGVVTRNVTSAIRENVGFSVSLADSISNEQSTAILSELTTAPYAAKTNFVSREEGARQWKEDTGEDIVQVVGFNPMRDEIEVHVKENFASTDSIAKITAALKADKRIAEIATHDDVVDAMNANIRIVNIVLISIAIVLVFITFVLINNTIRLTIHSRRFLIHTMKLVGAKASFIRRPFIVSNSLSGLIAGVLASFIVGGGFYYITILEPSLAKTITWQWTVYIAVGLIIVGILICAVSAFFAATRYVRLGYDKMFK